MSYGKVIGDLVFSLAIGFSLLALIVGITGLFLAIMMWVCCVHHRRHTFNNGAARFHKSGNKAAIHIPAGGDGLDNPSYIKFDDDELFDEAPPAYHPVGTTAPAPAAVIPIEDTMTDDETPLPGGIVHM